MPQGIVPFVFAKEYNVHPDILSTGFDLDLDLDTANPNPRFVRPYMDFFSCRVIFGMLIALPITLVYYILLGL